MAVEIHKSFPVVEIFATTSAGSSTLLWGNIAGTLANQTDLQAALDAKAPSTPQFLTLAAHSGIANERVFTPSADFTPTDGGAGSTYTLALATQGGLTPGTYNTFTVNNKGIITAASGVVGGSPITTRGDIIVGDVAGFEARLPVGAATYVLTSDGTDVSWAAPTGGGGGWATDNSTTTFTGDPTISGDNETYGLQFIELSSFSVESGLTGYSLDADDGAGNNTTVFGSSSLAGIVGLAGARSATINVGAGAGQLSIDDDRTVKTGIQYTVDLSAGFTARSLIDKGYADANLLGLPLPAAPTSSEDGLGLIWDDGSGEWIYGSGGGSMVYPGAGIPLSTGSAWGTSITDNSANWNTAYGWGNHASAGYMTLTGTQALTGNKKITGASATHTLSLGGSGGGDEFYVFEAAATFVGIQSTGTHRGQLYFQPSNESYFLAGNDFKVGLNSNASGGHAWLDTNGRGGDLKFVATNDVNTAYTIFNTKPASASSPDATGDIYYRNSSGYFTRLPIGSSTNVLTVTGGLPVWAAPSGGGSGTVTSVTSANADLTVATTTTTPVITMVQAPALRSATTTVNVSSATAPTSGQVLTATSGTAATWQTPASATGAWLLASGGTATGTNTFAMGSNPFILTSGVTTGTGATAGIQNVFNSLTTGNGLDISSSSVSSGSIVKITGTGTAAASSTQKGLWVAVSGANATSTQTTYGGYFSNTKTGTSATNIAGYFEASGGTNNIAIRTSGGGVGIGINPGVYDLSTSGAQGVSINSTTSSTPLYINASGSATGVFEMASLSARRNRIFFTSASTYFETPNIGIGGAATSNTSLDIRGTGTTTNKTLRTANSANTQTFEILDNANINALPLSGSIMTLGGGATASQLRFLEPSGSGTNYSSFSAVAQSADINYSLPPTVGAARTVLTDVAGNGVLTWEDKSLQSTTNTKSEKILHNIGTMGSSAVSTYTIHTDGYYSNSTTLLAKITVVAVKTDGSASAHSTVTARFRKNSSGTWSVDDAGTDITSDITILADVVGELSGSDPSVKVTMGAASGNYNVSWVAETIEVK